MKASSNQVWVDHKDQVLATLAEDKFNTIYGNLPNAKPSGDGWMLACCPFHKDEKPSFGFNTETGQWKCFSGCGRGSVFDFLIRQQHLPFKEVLSGMSSELGIPLPAEGQDEEKVYDYQDRDGSLLFQVVRKPGKKFRQRKPNGKGGWAWNLKGVKRVLFRLPDLICRPNDLVFIVEGEKDADRLIVQGLLATTSPGGAGKWIDEFSEVLAGRDVIILPDNDAPGRFHATQVAQSLVGKAKSIRILELPDLPDKGDVSDWLDAGGDKSRLMEMAGIARPYSENQDPATTCKYPVIQVNGRQIREIVHDAWQAILATNDPPKVFSSGGYPVRLRGTDSDLQIELMNEGIAFGVLIRTSDWIKTNGAQIIHSCPTREMARDLLANPHPGLPELESVIRTPVFDRDWRLISEPGYHSVAKVWLQRPDGFEELDVPSVPSQAEVANALSLILDDLLVDFPFTSDSDRTHAVAALLLPFARRMFDGPTPIHLIEAPTPGSGKSLLAELISIIALGITPGCTTLTKNEDESRKKLTAILSTGPLVVSIDNIEGGLWSSQFAAAITTPQWEDRLLGKTQMVTFPNRALWMVSGNNPKLSMEIVRRCIRIRLNPKEERPWMRQGFKHDPVREWTKQNRLELVRSILVLIQSWIVSGSQLSTNTLGSFETWSRLIGGVIEHHGLAGFLGDTEEFYAVADPETEEWRAFVLAWWDKFGTVPVAPALLLELAESKNLIPFAYMGSSERAQLAKFGKSLLRIRDRKFSGYQVIAKRNAKRGSNDYRLVAEAPDLFQGKEVE